MRNNAPINHFPPTPFSPNRSLIYGEAHFFRSPFPMPNPRHGQNPFQIAAVALPILIGAAVWKGVRAPVRVYFVATVLALAALMFNVVPLDRQLYDGLFQRLLALAVFPSVGVGCYVLRKRQFKA
jgi:hypothetical protein